MIFSGKGNIIFPDNTRKILFQRNFFWKVYSEQLEKENVFFLAVIETSPLILLSTKDLYISLPISAWLSISVAVSVSIQLLRQY